MISLIGIASGKGAGNRGCEEGPSFLDRNPRLLAGISYQWSGVFKALNSIEDPYDCLACLYQKVAEKTYHLSKQNEFFVGIGGDHSCAIGVWSGVAEALRPMGPLGLIWIDAHMDAHTKETSETGNIHGMPLAALMGYGDSRLTNVFSDQPKVDPSNLVLIGVRSYEIGEALLLQRLGVRIYYIEEVRRRGMTSILPEAIKYVSKKTVGYGVSFDLDSIDPSNVKGVGTPVEGGIPLDDFLASLDAFQATPPLALEIVEYNPSLDVDCSTAQVIKQILQKTMQFASRNLEILEPIQL